MTQKKLIILSFLPAFFLLAIVVNAQEQPWLLQPGKAVERQLGPGQAHTFTVNAQENSFVELTVNQQGIDVIVRLAAPNGKHLGEYDSPTGTEGAENVSFVASAAGAYHIVVAPLNENGDPASGRYQIKLIELRPATEEEIRAGRQAEALKVKGIALLGEAEGILTEITLPQTRIKAWLQMAQLLWEHDEQRAGKYLAGAANGVREFIAAVDQGSPEYFRDYSTIIQLRYETVQAMAKRDPDAALNFLNSTRLPVDPYGNAREQARQESELELSVVNDILRNDPQRAVKIARENLKKGYSQNLAHTLWMLKAKNSELAAELAGEIAAKLMGEKLLQDHEAISLTTNLLRMCPERTNQTATPVVITRGQRVNTTTGEPLLPHETCRELCQKAFQQAISFSPPQPGIHSPERDAAWSILSNLMSLGSLLDTLVPGAKAAIEKKLPAFNVMVNSYAEQFNEFHDSITNGSDDAALAAVEKAPEVIRPQLYLQLAGRVAATGDRTRARQIISAHVSNPYEKRQALANLEYQEIMDAANKGRIDEALRLIAALRTPSERADKLVQIIELIGKGKKRTTTLNSLEQALSLLSPGPQAQDHEQMNALLELAKVFSQYDSRRSFEIIEPLIDQLNDLCAAARTLEGFGIEFFLENELNLQNGSSIAHLATEMAGTLGTLSKVNFERAKLATDRLRLAEVRLKVYLEIARQTIDYK